MTTLKVKLGSDEIPTAESLLTLGGSAGGSGGGGGEAIVVPPLGVGLWSWGETKTWGYTKTPENDAAIKASFDASLLKGVNFFDTAEIYANGESERFLGNFLAADQGLFSGVNNLADKAAKTGKNKIVTATKFFPNPLYVGPWGYPGVLTSHLKSSLERLQLKQVDLYQIHGPIHYLTYIETIADALALSVKEGLVKTVGVSNYSVPEMRRMHAALAKHNIQLAVNQVEYSLLHQHPDHCGLIEEAHKLGVAILAYSPLGQGRLTGKFDVNNPPPSNRKFANVSIEQVQPLIEKLRELGAKYNKTPAQISLNWIICKGAILIPGAKNAKQAEENAGALGFRLTKEEVAELEKLGFEGSTNIWQHG